MVALATMSPTFLRWVEFRPSKCGLAVAMRLVGSGRPSAPDGSTDLSVSIEHSC